MKNWKVGDEVIISGGPVMTVDRVVDIADGKSVVCVWFVCSEIRRDVFSSEAVKQHKLASP
jgi:uncharacterized protein YodC (DUF2158 family)